MATELLRQLIELQMATSIGIVVVVVLRKAVRRHFGARRAYALWALPLFLAAMLLLPPPSPRYDEAAPVISAVLGMGIGGQETALAVADGLTASLLISIWFAGALIGIALMVVRQKRFHALLGDLRAFRPEMMAGVRVARASGFGPAVVGVFPPRIILPADFETRFTPDEQALILAHERAHLRSGDPVINLLVALVQCLSWFNPLVHFAVSRLRIDQELSADTIALSGRPDARRRYAQAMMKAQTSGAGHLLRCAWYASSGRALKERIVNLKLTSPSASQRAAGTSALIVLFAATGYGAWAAQPVGPATHSLVTAVNGGGTSEPPTLYMDVGSNIAVRTSDGRYSCSDNGHCNFEMGRGQTAELVAQSDGARALIWSGCDALPAADKCVVDLSDGEARIRVRHAGW